MDITQLSEKLLSDTRQTEYEKGFIDTYKKFINLINSFGRFGVYFDKDYNCANTIYLLKRLESETSIVKPDGSGRGNIFLLYSASDAKLCKKLNENLSFFNEYSRVESAETADFELLICGGGDIDDNMYDALNSTVKYVITVRPYLDYEDYCFIKIRNENKEFTTYFTDTIYLNKSFSGMNFYIESPKLSKLTDDLKKYWNEKYNSSFNKAESILSFSGSSFNLFTVDGLVSEGKSTATDRADTAIVILIFAMLQAFFKTGKSEQPYVLAMTDFENADNKCFDLIKAACDIKKDTEELLKDLKKIYPQADEEDIKTGLLNPIIEKRVSLGNFLDKVEIIDKECLPYTLQNKIYIFPVGPLPYDYMNAIFAKSNMLFFESCDYVNLAINIGVPYINKQIENAGRSYPSLSYPNIALNMEKICDIFKNSVSAYYTAVDDKLANEIDTLAEFFKNPQNRYFEYISDNAQGIDASGNPSLANDKFAASAGVFYSLSGLTYKSGKKNDDEFNPQVIYKKLCDNFNDEKKELNFSAALKGTRIEKYLSDIVSLSGEKTVVFTLTSKNDIELEKEEGEKESDAEIVGISIKNASISGLEGITLELSLSDWYDASGSTNIHGTWGSKSNLSGITWLTVSDISFDIRIPENNMPVSGAVSGYLGKTDTDFGINLCFMINEQDGISTISANCREPITTFDLIEAIAGGLNFNSLLPSELISGNPVITLGLSSFVFKYNRKKSEIYSMNFCFANKAENLWVLWEKDGKKLLSARPEVAIDVISPADMANRQTSVMIGSFVDIGSPEEDGDIGSLWLSASYPPFTAELRMASEKISLNKLIELFGYKTDFEADIIDLSITADFGKKIYQLSAAVEGNWKLSDEFVIEGIGLHILGRAGRFSVVFSGLINVFGIDVAVRIGYLGEGKWNLFAEAKFGDKIHMSDIINEYKDGNEITISDEDKDNPLIADVSFSLTKTDSHTDYEIAASVKDWQISLFGTEKTVNASALIGKNNGKFSAYLIAEINLLGADCKIKLNYSDTKSFELIWGVFHGVVENKNNETTVSISLSNFSIGKMIETFIGWLKGSEFSLDEPWNILEKFCFDFSLVYNFTKNQFSIKLELPKPIEIGFGKIENINVVYDKNAESKIDVSLDITYAWKKDTESISWDASEPGNAPVPAGSGSSYFDLNYLAFGQKMRFFDDVSKITSASAAITALKDNISPDKIPEFDKTTGMLIASDFGILKEKGTYFIKAELVFCDSSLYALHIALDSTAAKVLKGFSFDIIYAKLSETLGVFKALIVLPDMFRKFDIGAYSITMPDFYIEVYTNGDFKVDIGFPKNGDFSRSFTLEGIIPPGIPVTGSAGLYFGKLSSATAESSGVNLPKTDRGVFNPVIAFGLGIRLGIGKKIEYGGILKGGFSLTLSTILEGVIAKFHTYDGSTPSEPWYYYLKGSAAIVANVYGEIDFAIISASLNITLSLSVAFVYEICRAFLLTVSVMVKAAISLKINLGLFKISIGFSFEMKLTESFTIGKNTQAPWDIKGIQKTNSLPKQNKINVDFSNLKADKIDIKGCISLSITSSGDEYLSDAIFVLNNVIMTLNGGDNFKILAERLAYWVFAAVCEKEVTIEELKSFIITDDCLAEFENYFTQTQMPVTPEVAEEFCEKFIVINIQDNETEYLRRSNEETVSDVYFPLPVQIELTAVYKDEEKEKGKYKYKLSEYNSLANGALDKFKEMFKELAVTVENEGNEKDKNKFQVFDEKGVSVAQLVFCDWFSMAASQIVHSARRLYRDKGVSKLNVDTIMKEFSSGSVYSDMAGILSRYFLHGLRLPTTDSERGALICPNKKGLWVNESEGMLTLPNEAGIFALTGQSFMANDEDGDSLSVLVKSDASYLKIPDDFCLKIDTAAYDNEEICIEERISSCAESLDIEYLLEKTEAEFIPEIISFGNPAKVGNRNLWTMPEGLKSYFSADYVTYPKFDFNYVRYDTEIHKRNPDTEFISLIEFNIEASDINSVYFIKSASNESKDILTNIISLEMEEEISVKGISIIEGEKEISLGDKEVFWSISQINLSTQTLPPQDTMIGNESSILRLLWKAFSTNNNGYILTYRDNKGTKLNDKNKVVIGVSYVENIAEKNIKLSFVNAVFADKKLEEGENLSAFAREDSAEILSDNEFALSDIAEKYCTDIKRIADNNLDLILNSTVLWDFKDIVLQSGGDAKIIGDYKEAPKAGETLKEFAERNNVTPYYALWINRDKKNLFNKGQKICISVQAGMRAGSGSENTTSLINESFKISRKQAEVEEDFLSKNYEQSVLLNNYTLLSYGIKGHNIYSAPISYTEDNDRLLYNADIPADRYMGGSYASYGRLMEFDFLWLDYYGNRLIPPFYTACIAGYQDTLLGFSKWQSVGISYNIVDCTTSDKAVLRVKTVFSSADYYNDETGELRSNALSFYKRLQKQFLDKRVNVYLRCSIFDEVSESKNASAWKKMIEDIIAFLDKCREDVPEYNFEFSFNKNALSKSLFFPLEVSIVVERAGKADRGFEETAGIVSTESLLGIAEDIKKFAKDFREIYKGYILLTGGKSSALYVYKVSELNVKINSGKNIFLPKPFSNVLKSYDNVTIQLYENGSFGNSIVKNYQSVDINVWVRNALSFIDKATSANIVSAAGIVYYDYESILAMKKEIAVKLSECLVSALNDDCAVFSEAKEEFKQKLLGSLSEYFEVKAVVTFEADTTGLPENAKLYGSIKDENDNLVSYSGVKFENGSNKKYAVAISGSDAVLDKNGAVLASIDAKLKFTATHIESDIRPFIDDFNASQWHGAISDNITDIYLTDESEEKSVNVPLPLYTFPETPIMKEQKAEAGQREDCWRYAYTYSRTYHYPQQICRCKVKYNVKNEAKDVLNDISYDLFSLLAQIDATGSDILNDLEEIALEINESKKVKPDADLQSRFIKVYDCIRSILGRFAECEYDVLETCNLKENAEYITEFMVLEKSYNKDLFCIELDCNNVEPYIEGYVAKRVGENKDSSWIFCNKAGEYLSYAEGQKIKKRTMIMPEHEVLDYQNGIAEMYVEQNKNLCGGNINELFVYTTGIISFGSAINASCTINDVDLGQEVKDKKMLADKLIVYIKKLIKNNSVILQGQCVYSNKIYSNLQLVEMPVFSQTKVKIDVSSLEEVINKWILFIKDWRKDFKAFEFAQSEKLSFELVFFSVSEEVPLLTVKNLFSVGEDVVIK